MAVSPVSPAPARAATSYDGRRDTDRNAVHLQLSSLLLIGLVTGVISTVAVVVSAVVASQPLPHGGLGGAPPPPPPITPLIISCAFFVVSWVTVAAAVARDQIVHRITEAAALRSDMLNDLHTRLEEVHAEAHRDRESVQMNLLRHLDAFQRDFGEVRETEGYLSAMRAAATQATTNGDVRPLRKVPPPPPDA